MTEERVKAKRYAFRQEAAKAHQALANMVVYSVDGTLLETYKLTAMIQEINLMVAANTESQPGAGSYFPDGNNDREPDGTDPNDIWQDVYSDTAGGGDDS